MRRLPILTYHALDDTGSVVSTSPVRFRWQMECLKANRWRALSLDELLAGHARGEWPQRAFALTFDDGFVNFADHALPVLAQCAFTASVFVVTDWVGRMNDWPSQFAWVPRHPLMNWTQLRALATAGIEIGAHTVSHPHLARLSTVDAEREIVDCKHRIEDRIGSAAQSFAYPYGEISRAAEEAVARNYRAGYGTHLGFATSRSRATAFQRIDMYYLRQPQFFRALATGWLEWYLRLRHWARQWHWGNAK